MICLRLLPLLALLSWQSSAASLYIRANQVGYRPDQPKVAVAFSKTALPGRFTVADQPSGKVVFEGKPKALAQSWGQINLHAELDFTGLGRPGVYYLQMGEVRSHVFTIGQGVYQELPYTLLEFMRQQRCGFNPWLNTNCHQFDARTAYGPLKNGTYLDARGGWHDAADLLKYQLTSGNATAQLLLAHLLEPTPVSARQTSKYLPGSGPDIVGASGLPGANGGPDVLDEARWGLEWMLKLHPAPDQLYHQVADDRDHIGWRLPQNEIADYGWGKGSYRVVYFADGKPQGLQQYKSESTGIANLAGRYAAAMALAWQVWKDDPAQKAFAGQCLQAGREVYVLGRGKEGVQQGNSYKGPYRYEESTWADDMEWGAAELYRVTGEKSYLEDARRYAQLAHTDTWMGKEQTGHYQYFPFLNVGHFRLYDLVDREFKRVLAGYYREGIERCRKAGEANPYSAGAPFIWCSANLEVALATQCLLYERMTGDKRYASFAAAQRDWLLGRNPWGYTFFTGVGSVFPTDIHLMTTRLTGRSVRGGLVDGPVYERVFKSLKGVAITEPDPLAEFQGQAVYHNDFQDYSTNEPIMDGTAAAVLLWSLCAGR